MQYSSRAPEGAHFWAFGFFAVMSIPQGLGKYTNIDQFDRTIFKMKSLFAVSSDILNRKILEPAFEAMIDAGTIL